MHDPIDHLGAETLQAFLEGDLSRRECGRIEEHLASCARCSAELDGWRVLFEDLGGLDSHRPHEGFANRVMAGVSVPEPLSVGARVRDRLEVLGAGGHVPAELLQDFLEGSLAARRAERIGRHLGECRACTAEAEAWTSVMSRLDALDSFRPVDGFADRVMGGVRLPQPQGLVARMAARVAAMLGAAPEHVPAGLLQDLVDGALPERAVARIEAHVDECVVCTSELQAWRAVSVRLGELEQFAPSEHFRNRVMEALEAAGAEVAVSRPRLSTRAARLAGRLVPQTREAWAALTGVAVTPAVIVGLVFYAVFSHPTLTLGSLLSFLWWQAADAVGATGTALASLVTQNAGGVGATLFDLLSAAPALVAGGVVLYTIASALALRVLYRNLIAHVSSAS